MTEALLTLLENGKTLTVEDIFIRMLVSMIFGCIIYVSYYLSHVGTVYNKRFNVSLFMLTVLVATAMSVIGNNVAISLGMVGALSFVRFRTAIKDARDTAYIFWAIVAGISCGVGEYLIGAAGSMIVLILLLVLGRIKNDNKLMLIIRASKEKDSEISSVVFNAFNHKALLKAKNTTPDTVEFIFEMPRNVYNKVAVNESDVTAPIYALGDIYSVNIISQTDEII